jgi:predicted dehydrogenase
VLLSLLVFPPGAPTDSVGQAQKPEGGGIQEVKLITLDPGHFHAALIQKAMYPNVSKRVEVYAPLGADLIGHLNRVAQFNTRKESPTSWELEVHTGPDFLERMLREKAGNLVVISGRNRGKIDRIKASVEAGLNVLADKPWIIDAADLPKLEAALNTAEEKGLVAYDLMTSRFEMTSILQREIINDAGTFGTISEGTEREPAVYVESVHHLLKKVAGVPNLRPAWYFDVGQQGEGLADVGTHLVDRVQWTLFPDRTIDYRTDVAVGSARRWPTMITREQFRQVTGESDFPPYLSSSVTGDRLSYFSNTLVSYTERGVHITIKALWNFEAPPGGGDTSVAIFKGTKSRVEVRQGAEQKYQSELYVLPNSPADKTSVRTALARKIEGLQTKYPGLAVEDLGHEMRVVIPARYRLGHEANFAEVTDKVLRYMREPKTLPAWEKAGMLAKYYITTKGVALSRQNTDTTEPAR